MTDNTQVPFCLARQGSHRAVVILRASVAVFLAPVDLEEPAAADLTQSLMGGLVHTWSKPDVIGFFFSIMSCDISLLLQLLLCSFDSDLADTACSL